ncbi:MAG: pyridoxal phosphate-dependent aminotransferase family protein [Candidatus Eremiobacteraeota bacterium]|nr:pyridoxal phosphate-dependent aminotransferase family protein [Candidatus Eremiobacteraeota bacterium]
MSYLDGVREALDAIRLGNRYREIAADQPRYFADFSTNDYLGLAADSRVVAALRQATRAGAGGARLLGGRFRDQFLLEEELAAWLGRERALLFSSGYLAALGAISVLARFACAAYSDALNHASLIDGLRLTALPRTIYPHLALPARESRKTPALVVTESLYGMDGDAARLRHIVDDLNKEDIVLIDEAHAIGVMGENAAGLAAGIRDDRVVVMGTLSKALGGTGGFVAGPRETIDLLVNSARTFIYDTALAPASALSSRVALMLACGPEGDRCRASLRARVERLRAGLARLGLPVPAQFSPVVPILLGDERKALAAQAACLKRGVYAPAVRPPTVPAGASRLRLSVRADHTDVQIDTLLEALACVDFS